MLAALTRELCPRLHQNPEIAIGFVFLQRSEVLRADQLAVPADKVQAGGGAAVKLDGRAVLGCLKADAIQKDVRRNVLALAIDFDPLLKIPVRICGALDQIGLAVRDFQFFVLLRKVHYLVKRRWDGKFDIR